MNRFISRFNDGVARLNVGNTYLADDEYATTLVYKIARENDLSLCDWCCAAKTSSTTGTTGITVHRIVSL